MKCGLKEFNDYQQYVKQVHLEKLTQERQQMVITVCLRAGRGGGAVHGSRNEQKGCKKRSRGTKDQLIIDKTVLKDCRNRKTNLAMAWIDYKKAYDMVSHSWIMECLDMIRAGAADAVKCPLGESMKTWRTNLTANDECLGKVNIRRGIFQGDSLSPLLFALALFPLSMILQKVSVGYEMTKDGCRINHLLFMDDLELFAKNDKEIDSLVQTVWIFSNVIGMKFGLEKCAAMTMKRGKRVHSDGIALPDGTQLRALGEEESYTYLGVLEADHVLHEESKERLKKYKTSEEVFEVQAEWRKYGKGDQHLGCVANEVQCGNCRVD